MAYFLHSLLLFVSLQAVLSQQQNETCPSLARYTEVHTNCSSIGGCDGLFCHVYNNAHSPAVEGNASFTVIKCQDPVVVNLTVVIPNLGLSFTRSFTDSTTVPSSANSAPVFVQMSRNTTHLRLSVTTVHMLETVDIFSSVQVPLNASGCMCVSLQNMSQGIQDDSASSLVSRECHTYSNCSGIYCYVHGAALPSSYDAYITVYPCHDPPAIGITVVDRLNRQEVFSRNFSNSENVPLGNSGTVLSVDIVHHNYSMDVSATVNNVPLVGTQEVIPRRTIILDRSSCSNTTTTTTPPTASTSPTVTEPSVDPSETPGISSATCQALRNISSSASSCHTSELCNAVECNIPPYHSEMTVLPCHNPPAIGIIVEDYSNDVLFNHTFSHSEKVPVLSSDGAILFYLNVSVIQTEQEDSITVKVDAISLTGQVITIVPTTTIPIDRSSCFPGSGSPPTDITTETSPTATGGPTGGSTATGGSTEGSTATGSPTGNGVKSSGNSKAVIMGVAIAVPLGVVVILLVVALVIITAVLLYRRYGRSRQYQFQRVAFSDVQNGEEEV